MEQARAEVSRLRARSQAAVAERLRSIMARLYEAVSAELGSLGDGVTGEAATAVVRKHVKDITRRATRQGPAPSPLSSKGGKQESQAEAPAAENGGAESSPAPASEQGEGRADAEAGDSSAPPEAHPEGEEEGDDAEPEEGTA